MLIFWDLPNHFRNIIEPLKQEQQRFFNKKLDKKMGFSIFKDYEKKYLTSTALVPP